MGGNLEINSEFIFKDKYHIFSIGDRGKLVEVIKCDCCEHPLVLCKVVDNKKSKYTWIEMKYLESKIK